MTGQEVTGHSPDAAPQPPGVLAALSHSPEETFALGEALGRAAPAGAIILLEGELGAGKTWLTKGIASGLRIDPDQVTSPTYTIAHVHDGGPRALVHVDAYRLDGPEAWIDLDVEAMCPPDAVMVIEWASRVAEALPTGRLEVSLAHAGGDQRSLSLRGTGPAAQAILHAREVRESPAVRRASGAAASASPLDSPPSNSERGQP